MVVSAVPLVYVPVGGADTDLAFLLALGVSIILQSIERFIQPNHVLDPILVLAIGAAGVGSNILMVMVMGGAYIVCLLARHSFNVRTCSWRACFTRRA